MSPHSGTRGTCRCAQACIVPRMTKLSIPHARLASSRTEGRLWRASHLLRPWRKVRQKCTCFWSSGFLPRRPRSSSPPDWTGMYAPPLWLYTTLGLASTAELAQVLCIMRVRRRTSVVQDQSRPLTHIPQSAPRTYRRRRRRLRRINRSVAQVEDGRRRPGYERRPARLLPRYCVALVVLVASISRPCGPIPKTAGKTQSMGRVGARCPRRYLTSSRTGSLDF